MVPGGHRFEVLQARAISVGSVFAVMSPARPPEPPFWLQYGVVVWETDPNRNLDQGLGRPPFGSTLLALSCPGALVFPFGRKVMW